MIDINILTIPELYKFIRDNKIIIKGYNYLPKKSLINSILQSSTYNSYIGGKSPIEDTEDFKPLPLDKDTSDEIKIDVKKDVKKDIDDDDDETKTTTTISFDNKGNMIVLTFIPKSMIKS